MLSTSPPPGQSAPSIRHLCQIFWGLALGLSLPALAQTTAADTHRRDPTDALALAWGAGLMHYQEPGRMRLVGPEVTLQTRYTPSSTNAWLWPERLQADLGAALLDYASNTTGSLHHHLGLNARGTTLWRIHTGEKALWRAGMQLDLAWTDLRGTSSTGHQGYRRLSSKAWALVQHETASGATAEVGALLRGQQDSLLSDANGRDVTNTQRHGLYLAYQHPPFEGWWHRPRLWARYSQIGRSDNDGIHYEPQNQTLQIGLLFDF